MVCQRVLSVVGARPQFIKAAVVSRIFLESSNVREILVHTGQHYDEGMSDVFFEQLSIPAPAYNLSVGSGSHGQQTGRMLEKIEEIVRTEKPDWVLVYGDTNSTLAGTLAASKLHVPVAHVEAGLRSFNRRMPEEQNRIVSDHLATLLLTPTETANRNLANEGILGNKVRLVGDVMYDATLFASGQSSAGKNVLDDLDVAEGSFVLSTIHRAENTDDPKRLAAIIDGLRIVAKEMPVLLPLHPRTRKLLEKTGSSDDTTKGLTLLEPVGYFEMAALEEKAALIATDSGGIQKEAYFHATPCVTLRDETEWIELVELGWNIVQPPVSAQAVAATILSRIGTKGRVGTKPYGEGNAGRRVVDALLEKQSYTNDR